jgi:hypothetical protein
MRILYLCLLVTLIGANVSYACLCEFKSQDEKKETTATVMTNKDVLMVEEGPMREPINRYPASVVTDEPLNHPKDGYNVWPDQLKGRQY